MARARRGIRIIGGQWRGSRLPIADSNAIRPTPDRVRETLFNWLRDDVSGARCLDLFAGSGALGLEAASRGAAHVVLVEHDRNAFLTLEQSCERLHAATVEPVMAGALEWLAGPPQRFDLVFVDPPFDSGLWSQVLGLLRAGWLNDNARVYLETPKHGVEIDHHWQVVKSGQTSQTRYALLSQAS